MCIHTYIDSLCLYFLIKANLDDQSFLPFFQDSRLQCVELLKLKEIYLLCQEQCWFIVPEVEPSVPLLQTSLLEAHLTSSQSWPPFFFLLLLLPPALPGKNRAKPFDLSGVVWLLSFLPFQRYCHLVLCCLLTPFLSFVLCFLVCHCSCYTAFPISFLKCLGGSCMHILVLSQWSWAACVVCAPANILPLEKLFFLLCKVDCTDLITELITENTTYLTLNVVKH